MTQAELAKVTGLSRAYIADLEQGRGQASINVLAIIAAALGVHVDRLKGRY